MTATTATYAPRGLGAAGRRLWKSVTDDFDLEGHEKLLLTEVCRTADLCNDLAARAAKTGGSKFLVELRQQRLTLARLMSAMKLPSGIAEDQAPPSPIRKRAANKPRQR